MCFTPQPMYKLVVFLKQVTWLGLKIFWDDELATWRMVFWVLVEFQRGWYGFQAAGLPKG